MDTKLRLTMKAISWQLLGLVSMAAIGYYFTGSFSASGGIAIVGCTIGFISYFLHEILWSKIQWGRR